MFTERPTAAANQHVARHTAATRDVSGTALAARCNLPTGMRRRGASFGGAATGGTLKSVGLPAMRWKSRERFAAPVAEVRDVQTR